MPKNELQKNNTFTSRVNAVVQGIPTGSVLSYQAVAAHAGRPRAARAVANILAKNYDPSIPCHRVIKQNGMIGGYNRGGETAKRAVLCNEGYCP